MTTAQSKSAPPYAIYLLFLVVVLNVVAVAAPIAACLKHTPQDDEIVQYEKAMQAVRPLLPPGAVVGYVADREVTSDGKIRLDGCRRFYMTQYALAPNIIVHDTSKTFVVGNFSSAAQARAAADQHGLLIVSDFGNGLVLLRQKSLP